MVLAGRLGRKSGRGFFTYDKWPLARVRSAAPAAVRSPGSDTSMIRIAVAQEGLEALFGIHDQNLKRIEKAFEVRISARGNEVAIDGPEGGMAQAAHLLSQLSTLAEGGFDLRAEDVRTALRVVQQAPASRCWSFSSPPTR